MSTKKFSAPPTSGGRESSAATGDGGSSQKSPAERAQERGPKPVTLSLPKGGGALRPIGEKSSASVVTGSVSAEIPLPVTAARGAGPSIGLGYDSGAGNGPFGLGWTLSAPSITRKTERGLPTYDDERDTFIISGAEELVPRLKDNAGTWIADAYTATESDAFGEHAYEITRYRPRTEGGFSRIERWRRVSDGDVHWRTLSASNSWSIFGRTSASRIADPAQPSRVFSWLLDESSDDRGNVVTYAYVAEDLVNVDTTALHERHRAGGASPVANRYLKRVRWGNSSPNDASTMHFELVFDYGDHDTNAPTPTPSQSWPARLDPFSSYKPGFEVRTYRRCVRALLFHSFAELGSQPLLVSGVEFSYVERASVTTMIAACACAYTRQSSGAYTVDRMPPVQYGYTERALDGELREGTDETEANLPFGIDGQGSQWVDLDGEGLSGVLTEQAGAWFYKRNLGDGRLAPMEPIAAAPNVRRGAHLAAIEGSGAPRLLVRDAWGAGVFERDDVTGDWSSFAPFTSWPKIDWSDPSVRSLDLDGDGEPDVMLLHDNVVRWHKSLGREGYAGEQRWSFERDERKGPRLVHGDKREAIFVADMSGDGLMDLVRVRYNSVEYWPNLGYGRFGAKVTLSNVSELDRKDTFDPGRVRMADVDGTGPTDLIYLGADAVRLYANQSGNRLGTVETLPAFPAVHELSHVAVFDFRGRGTACLVWFSSAPNDHARRLRYVDLMGGVKPWLMTSITNGFGGETRYRYAPSTQFALADRLAGKPWKTRLPFPVWVVDRVEVRDAITGHRFVTRRAYHHGYYDRDEREFRGFGMVEAWDAEQFDATSETPLFSEVPTNGVGEVYAPPVYTKTWVHNGAFFGREAIEAQFASEYWAGDALAPKLPDTELPSGLSAKEQREACRALRGQTLRSEVYALDGSADESTPYAVTEAAFIVRRIQPATDKRHGAFQVIAGESVELHYERNASDPRLAHSMTLAVNEYGAPTRTASIAYPRRGNPTYTEQSVLHVSVSEAVIGNTNGQSIYELRLGVPIESKGWFLTGMSVPTRGYFTRGELNAAFDSASEIAHETTPSHTALQKRMLTWGRHYYRDEGLDPMGLGLFSARVIPYRDLAFVFTPGMLTNAFGSRVNSTMLTDAGYEYEAGVWWAATGTSTLDYDHFLLPTAVSDPFGNTSTATYDSYYLTAISATDPLGNTSSVEIDYRTLSPWRMTDANGNRSAVKTDAFGRVLAAAVMGKVGSTDGDTLEAPTVEFEYGDFSWMDYGQPTWARTRSRETHGASNTLWQESVGYVDGFGRVLLTKTQAEPGLVPQLDANGRLVRNSSGEVQYVDTGTALRWIGSGRTIVNNKGKPVKQYEPYFSSHSGYEAEDDAITWGVTPIVHYDSMGRVVRTDAPDGTFARVEFTPWYSKTYDASDTVLESDWYAERATLPTTDSRRRAADQSAEHANTPSVAHLDSLGRAFIAIADNGSGGLLVARTEFDDNGRAYRIFDARNVEIQRTLYDATDTALKTVSCDGGTTYAFFDVMGRPHRSWSARGFVLRAQYDAASRPTHQWVLEPGASTEKLVGRTVYGESLSNPSSLNLRGKPYLSFDSAGEVVTNACDFKGNVLSATRRFVTGWTSDPDWISLASLNDVTAIQTAANALLESESFTSTSEFDALNRATRVVHPDASDVRPAFNRAGLLESLSVYVRGASSATTFVSSVDYDVHGRRKSIAYGNNVSTTYSYDPRSFRLTRLRSTRSNGDVLQDVSYEYDAGGNLTELLDNGDQSQFFNGSVVSNNARYWYDAIGRLVKAEGREHPGTVGNAQSDWTDGGRGKLAHKHDGSAMRRYTQEYEFDAGDNLKKVIHTSGSDSWSRRYAYATDSNRLLSTSLPGDSENGPYSATYTYDDAGNMLSMSNVSAMTWDHSERFREANLGGGGTAYYLHDGSGQRVRKVIQRTGSVREVRVYTGATEVFRKYIGSTLDKERHTLRVMDDERCVCEVDTLTVENGSAVSVASPLLRYRVEDHLGSAGIELDENAAVIAYEVFHPWGTVAVELRSVDCPERRYRYTGMERDEETGLQRHGVRSYAPWLGRWTSADPAGLVDGSNRYGYCQGQIARVIDRSGMGSEADCRRLDEMYPPQRPTPSASDRHNRTTSTRGRAQPTPTNIDNLASRVVASVACGNLQSTGTAEVVPSIELDFTLGLLAPDEHSPRSMRPGQTVSILHPLMGAQTGIVYENEIRVSGSIGWRAHNPVSATASSDVQAIVRGGISSARQGTLAFVVRGSHEDATTNAEVNMRLQFGRRTSVTIGQLAQRYIDIGQGDDPVEWIRDVTRYFNEELKANEPNRANRANQPAESLTFANGGSARVRMQIASPRVERTEIAALVRAISREESGGGGTPGITINNFSDTSRAVHDAIGIPMPRIELRTSFGTAPLGRPVRQFANPIQMNIRRFSTMLRNQEMRIIRSTRNQR